KNLDSLNPDSLNGLLHRAKRSDSARDPSPNLRVDSRRCPEAGATLTNAASLLVRFASDEFHPPSIAEFFPEILFSIGPLSVHRIHLVQFLATIVVVLILWLGTRKLKLVPGRGQAALEMLFSLVRVNIGHDMMGKKDGDRFLPLLTTIFFMTLFFNITGVI